jgi:hypothetical protein
VTVGVEITGGSVMTISITFFGGAPDVHAGIVDK